MPFRQFLSDEERAKFEEAEEYIKGLERRHFDRRETTKWKQVSTVVSLLLAGITFGSCMMGFATKAGWTFFGPSDEIAKMKVDISDLKVGIAQAKDERAKINVFLQVLVATNCAHATNTDIVIMRANGINCSDYIPQLQVSPR